MLHKVECKYKNEIHVCRDFGKCSHLHCWRNGTCPENIVNRPCFFCAIRGLCGQVLHVNDLDCPMAIGYMLALDKSEAYEIFKRNIRLSKDDYGRCDDCVCVCLCARGVKVVFFSCLNVIGPSLDAVHEYSLSRVQFHPSEGQRRAFIYLKNSSMPPIYRVIDSCPYPFGQAVGAALPSFPENVGKDGGYAHSQSDC